MTFKPNHGHGCLMTKWNEIFMAKLCTSDVSSLIFQFQKGNWKWNIRHFYNMNLIYETVVGTWYTNEAKNIDRVEEIAILIIKSCNIKYKTFVDW